MTERRRLRVFLCHSSHDKPLVRELYQQLKAQSWLDLWLDEENLLPGQDWDMEIEKAVEVADVVIVCLSSNSVSKEGYIQRELKFVLDIALEKPEGTIFVIPIRLQECELPRRLRSWQYVDYFPADQQKRAHQRLLQSLNARHSQITSKVDASEKAESLETVTSQKVFEEKTTPEIKMPVGSTASSNFTPIGILDLGTSVLPIVYFLLAGFYAFGDTDSQMQFLLAVAAILTGFSFLFKRQMVAGIPLKISAIIFLLAHSVVSYSNKSGLDVSIVPSILEGVAAFIVTGLMVANFRSIRKPAPYFSILLAVFLFLVGIKLSFDLIQYYPDIYTPIIISGIVASILLWLEL